MKVLLINSDLANNRGDRAIAEGIIQLIKECYPDAEITGLSEMVARDQKWLGINFLDMNVHTLNPLNWIKLMGVARKADVVYWGGGELLKDYTNKLALWYWTLKILSLWLVQRNIYGTYQGIGPTRSRSSKAIIKFAVQRTKLFIVRDSESRDKLIGWGVKPELVLASSDPAILPDSHKIAKTDTKQLEKLGITNDSLSDFIAVAPRDWFHYRKSGFIPHRFKVRLGLAKQVNSAEHDKYLAGINQLLESLLTHTKNILILPMHMEEDVPFCNSIISQYPDKNIRILSDDTVSPVQLRKLLSKAKLMVGFRLHSTIIATSSDTPGLAFYYVDKGRVFFDQIKQSENAFPIEALIDKDSLNTVFLRISEMLKDGPQIISDQNRQLNKLRQDIRSAFNKVAG